MLKDRLTERERLIYRLVHGLSLLWGVGGFLWLFLGGQTDITPLVSIVYVVGCSPVLIFGLALKTDTRLIHGIPWLRDTKHRGS
jgi:hypothetical protein